jgi:hypothetical protein
MKKILLFCLLLIPFLNSNAQKSISPDGVFNYQINFQYELQDNLLPFMKKANPSIIQLAKVKFDDKSFLLGISKLEGDNIESIDAVVKNYVYNIKANSHTRNIEGKTFIKDGKYYHRKITISIVEGSEVYNVMYYFMKGNKSKILYEMKASGSNKYHDLIDTTLFTIANTVHFK